MTDIKVIDKYTGRYCRLAGVEVYGVYLQQDEDNEDNAIILKTNGSKESVNFEYLHFLTEDELRLNTKICQVGDVGYIGRDGCIDISSLYAITEILSDKVTITVADPVTGEEAHFHMDDFLIKARPSPMKRYDRTREDDQ